jgi:1-acyl-sn-glycerol-3-phosphate acyltransferase
MGEGKRWRGEVQVERPGSPSPAFVGFARSVLRPLVRLDHRPTLEGIDHLPASGPYLLVANHSAGMAIAEIACFIVLYLDQVGPERPLAGFAHPLSFGLFPANVVLRHVGGIPSTYEAAYRTLEKGVPILVFPGGDYEAMRPIWQAHRVDFGGRKGFLRIARKARVPIVPMGIRGSHFTAPILWRSALLAWLVVLPRVLGLRRWPITLLGLLVAIAIALGVPWAWPWRVLLTVAWLGSPFIFWPILPWKIRMRIGPPIPPEDLFSDRGSEEEVLRGALERVESEIQKLVKS